MNKFLYIWKRLCFGIVALMIAVIALVNLATSIRAAEAASAEQNFNRAIEPREWTFPKDHGKHIGFKTEWWYFTGNLKSKTGRDFGYQLTFFRTRFSSANFPRTSPWAMNDLYFAHFAVSDVAEKKLHYRDRLSRERDGLAMAADDCLNVYLKDWKCTQVQEGIHLLASEKGLAIDLLLKKGKGPILQGPGGLNLKGKQPGEASYYYSMTRQSTLGTLTIDDRQFEVTGQSWMDHEFSSNSLGEKQSGWDWLALTLDDGSELMIYRLRDNSGKTDFISGTRIDAKGNATYLPAAEIELTPGQAWISKSSGAAYPQAWSLKVKGLPAMLIQTRIEDQELQTPNSTNVTYYEGSIGVTNEKNQPIGLGYLEMTGYAKSMGDSF